ncbi:MAG: D-alanyl-D-alanine dipeptidase [Acidobacteria bacterium]|nr:D-alanyl-D-alanine dipeptidase [Acidobacteriota bacterium]
MRTTSKRIATLLLFAACATVDIAPNRYGLRVVPDVATYQRLAAGNRDKELVEVTSVDPTIALDVRYATTNNFMKETLYPIAKVFLRRPAAMALANAERELAKRGLGLKVFDGYRPYRVTERMWEPIRNPDFVADPAKGSRHNRGAAVDVTLIELATGHELAMPTPYDDFTSHARQDFDDVTPEVRANRARLRDVLARNGFEPLPSEWWHFDFRGWERFELLDVPLEDVVR